MSALSAAAYLGVPKILAQEGAAPVRADAEKDYQIKAVRLYIRKNSLPQGGYDFSKNQVLTYDNVLWSPAVKDKPPFKNIVMGQLRLERRHSGKNVEYAIKQENVACVFEGSIVCRNDGFLTPLEWNFKTWPVRVEEDALKLSTLEFSGKFDGKKAVSDFGLFTREFDCGGAPIITQWQLLDGAHVFEALSKKGKVFYFDDAFTAFGPRVLKRDGTTAALGKDKKKYATWICCGEDFAPQHVMVSETGMPVMLTGFVNSWVLKSVEEA